MGLRKIISTRQVEKVLKVLRSKPTAMVDDWKVRYQTNLEKIKGGSIMEVAAVARNLYRRNQEKELSIMERKLFENAYQMIVGEIALTRNMQQPEAEDMVSQALE